MNGLPSFPDSHSTQFSRSSLPPASYAPVTVLIDERAGGVHLSYDLIPTFLPPHENAPASAEARQLDEKVLALLTTTAVCERRVNDSLPTRAHLAGKAPRAWHGQCREIVTEVDQIPVWHRNVAAMESGWRDLWVIAKEHTDGRVQHYGRRGPRRRCTRALPRGGRTCRRAIRRAVPGPWRRACRRGGRMAFGTAGERHRISEY